MDKLKKTHSQLLYNTAGTKENAPHRIPRRTPERKMYATARVIQPNGNQKNITHPPFQTFP
jgi:hypothetical protein